MITSAMPSFQLLQLLLHDLGLQRNEHALVGDHLLALPAQHELQKFLDLGRQMLPGALFT